MIPKGFISEYLEKAQGARFFGVPVEELSRDELIACAIAGWSRHDDIIRQHSRELTFLRSMSNREHSEVTYERLTI